MSDNNEMPVSVVIPTYNRAALIGRSVESVIAATGEGDEIIVVDDGSTDDTEQALMPYSSKIRYLRIPNSGAGAARNHGVRMAKHDLVAFNDSDDLWLADRLELQRVVMRRRPDLLFCFSDFVVRHEDGSEVRHGLEYWHKDPRSWDDILGPGVRFSTLGMLPAGRPDFHVHFGHLYAAELRWNFVSTITVLVRRTMAGVALHFPEDVGWAEDWECYARLAGVGLAAYLDCETARNCAHSGSRLTDADAFVKAGVRLGMLERVWGADASFLCQHRDLYRKEVAQEHLARARFLIAQGKTRNARDELRLANGGPMTYRLLAAMPGPFVRSAVLLRRALRRVGSPASLSLRHAGPRDTRDERG